MPASSFIITWPTLAREQFAVRAEPHARRAINDLINSLFDYLDPLMVAAHVRKVPLPITAYEQAKNSTTPDLYDVLEEMLLVTVAEEDKYDHLFAIMRGYFQFMRTIATYKPDGITDHVRDHAPEFWRVMWANSKWLFFDLFKGLENEGTSDPWYIRTGLSVVLCNFVTLDQAGPKEKSSRTKDGCFELLASFWLFGPFGTDFSKQGADFALDHYESLEWASTYKPGSDVPKKAVSWIAGLGTERILDKLWDNLNDTRLSYHTLSQTAVLLSWVAHAAPGNEVLDLFSRKSVSRSLMLAVERVLNLGEFGDGFLPSYRQLLGSARRTINGVMNAATKFNRPLTTDILRPVDVIQALVAQVDACLFYGSVICTYPATIFLDDIQKYRTMTTPLGINEMKIALRAKWYPALMRIRTHENKAASLCTQSHGVKKADHTLAGLLREWQKLGRDFDLDEEEERLRHERHDARVHCSWYQCPWHHLEAPHSLFACTGCRDAYYCGKNCQKSDWHEGGHRERCRRLTGSSKKKLALKGDA